MTATDEKISASLNADDEAFLKELDMEPPLFEQVGGSFAGPMRRLTMFANIAAVIATLIGLFAIWKLFEATATRDLILWAMAVWGAWTVQIAIKQWIWNRINMLNIMRELKRVELRIARKQATQS